MKEEAGHDVGTPNAYIVDGVPLHLGSSVARWLKRNWTGGDAKSGGAPRIQTSKARKRRGNVKRLEGHPRIERRSARIATRIANRKCTSGSQSSEDLKELQA